MQLRTATDRDETYGTVREAQSPAGITNGSDRMSCEKHLLTMQCRHLHHLDPCLALANHEDKGLFSSGLPPPLGEIHPVGSTNSSPPPSFTTGWPVSEWREFTCQTRAGVAEQKHLFFARTRVPQFETNPRSRTLPRSRVPA